MSDMGSAEHAVFSSFHQDHYEFGGGLFMKRPIWDWNRTGSVRIT